MFSNLVVDILSHPDLSVLCFVLVRSGCDMGDLCVLSGQGFLYVYGAVSFLGSLYSLPRLVLN